MAEKDFKIHTCAITDTKKNSGHYFKCEICYWYLQSLPKLSLPPCSKIKMPEMPKILLEAQELQQSRCGLQVICSQLPVWKFEIWKPTLHFSVKRIILYTCMIISKLPMTKNSSFKDKIGIEYFLPDWKRSRTGIWQETITAFFFFIFSSFWNYSTANSTKSSENWTFRQSEHITHVDCIYYHILALL